MTMEWIDTIRSHLLGLPGFAKFAVVMAGIVGVPVLARRLGIPALVGLLVFGAVLGPHALDVAGPNHPIAQFFADLGKLMLLFTAGLEIDIKLFRQAQTRAIIFGLITTAVPQVLGTAYGLAAGYPLIGAVVIGSLLASHSPIALPIVTRLGAVGLEPVVVTIGATVVSDMLSLIVFGICVSTYTTGFSPSGLALQVVEIAVFVPLILIGVSRAGGWMLSKVRDNEEGSFVVMLGLMAVAAVLADLINLPGIVGAFLAGLAVNVAVESHPAKEKLQFVGKALFIPLFFVVTGFLIGPVAFTRAIIDNFPLVAGIIASLIFGKGIAAYLAGRAFGYPRHATLTMWSLTLPQVAATLAAALVGYDTLSATGVRLLDEKLLNAVLVMMVVTSCLGPILTELFTPRMIEEEGRATGVRLEGV
jgi:Kef-type K+ transport system membrane component KefB